MRGGEEEWKWDEELLAKEKKVGEWIGKEIRKIVSLPKYSEGMFVLSLARSSILRDAGAVLVVLAEQR